MSTPFPVPCPNPDHCSGDTGGGYGPKFIHAGECLLCVREQRDHFKATLTTISEGLAQLNADSNELRKLKGAADPYAVPAQVLDTFITSLLAELGEKPFLLLPENRIKSLHECMRRVISLRNIHSESIGLLAACNDRLDESEKKRDILHGQNQSLCNQVTKLQSDYNQQVSPAPGSCLQELHATQEVNRALKENLEHSRRAYDELHKLLDDKRRDSASFSAELGQNRSLFEEIRKHLGHDNLPLVEAARLVIANLNDTRTALKQYQDACDEAFQNTGTRQAILPDFVKLGRSKAEAVVTLAKDYLAQQKEIASLVEQLKAAQLKTEPAPTPLPLPSCPHCNCCVVGMRVITSHENQSGCPPQGFTKYAVACAACGVQGPTSESRESARRMWAQWVAKL